MALEWFEPDLQMGDPTLHPDWMDDYQEFALELQTNFGPDDPIGDAEQQLDHLSMKDGQHINKYIVEFNHLATQDEISQVGKPQTLGELRTLAQTIDSRYWEHKSEVTCQTKMLGTQSLTSKGNSNTTSSKPPNILQTL
ncbi:hypothetical protein PAXRUDRAFT_15732 [Paxillus rubicundulus Ve08.2h10]|uniref:Unplaced genomic scaffold scaffold_1172, whole genome shotgun sequence n=1 Tax=Paxillus rubicundulus Ve08.2h10 TaxID=930991 RepID=A0A0D0DP29_9AGAM|nr:hypothetical protein PAXRUDRAFT_15732 [Paxillus rubicundulus Ve08.2h10]